MDIELFFDTLNQMDISKIRMANNLGLSKSAFWRKCKGITQFTYSEICCIADILGWEITKQIFFAKKVS